MKVAVLGGSGFIGTRLCRRIEAHNDHQFAVLDKSDSSFYKKNFFRCDVRSVSDLIATIVDFDVIVNLAAEHRDDVTPISLYDDVNVGGARNICEVARQKNINTIIFTSSVAVYGFAPVGTDESGVIAPFNDYGRTKYEAELVFKAWQEEKPEERTLVIIRPTVVFGEQNRGNVYNLLKQMASGRFLMVGSGQNSKSMAYVENITAFIEHSLTFKPGIHIYNFVDKPDLTMNSLVGIVNRMFGMPEDIRFRLPYWLGYSAGMVFDLAAKLTGKKFTISSIRVKKFCSNTVFATSVEKTGFKSPVPLMEALERTVRHEFLEDHNGEQTFFTE